MDIIQLDTQSATLQGENLVRMEIPPEDVPRVLTAITRVTSLRYGRYEGVAFMSSTGTLQFKPLAGSKEGETDLYQLPSDEISFTVPDDEAELSAVIEAIYESHPYEEPSFDYAQDASAEDNPNKWWEI